MQEIVEQLKSYLQAIWRFRWTIHMVAWPMCIGGWLMVMSLPDQYEAKARVFVDTQSVLRPLLRGLAVDTDITEGVRHITQTLLSRPNLEEVARMTDMDIAAETPEEMDELIKRLRASIRLTGDGRNNLYSIAYTNSSPDQAKAVVQALLTLFVESSLGDSRKDTDTAERFLEEQIEVYERKLTDAENSLKEFKRKNLGLMPGEGTNYYSQLTEARANLAQAKLLLEEALKRRDEFKRQLEGEVPGFGFASSPTTSNTSGISHPLDDRIATLETRMEELMLQFTDKHPDVVAISDTVQRLKEQREKEIAQMMAERPAAPIAAKPLERNPVYQQLRVSLGESEAQVSSLQARVTAYQKRVDDLTKMIDTVPAVEAELSQLNRDYDLNKKNYETLLARLESAKLARQAESSSNDVKFKVVDPPRKPLKPVGPNRPLFMAVVLVGGAIAGLGFAFFLAMLKPAFYSEKMLRQATNLPVYGSISMVWTEKQMAGRKMEMMSFIAVALMLVFSFVLALWLQSQGYYALFVNDSMPL